MFDAQLFSMSFNDASNDVRKNDVLVCPVCMVRHAPVEGSVRVPFVDEEVDQQNEAGENDVNGNAAGENSRNSIDSIGNNSGNSIGNSIGNNSIGNSISSTLNNTSNSYNSSHPSMPPLEPLYPQSTTTSSVDAYDVVDQLVREYNVDYIHVGPPAVEYTVNEAEGATERAAVDAESEVGLDQMIASALEYAFHVNEAEGATETAPSTFNTAGGDKAVSTFNTAGGEDCERVLNATERVRREGDACHAAVRQAILTENQSESAMETSHAAGVNQVARSTERSLPASGDRLQYSLSRPDYTPLEGATERAASTFNTAGGDDFERVLNTVARVRAESRADQMAGLTAEPSHGIYDDFNQSCRINDQRPVGISAHDIRYVGEYDRPNGVNSNDDDAIGYNKEWLSSRLAAFDSLQIRREGEQERRFVDWDRVRTGWGELYNDHADDLNEGDVDQSIDSDVAADRGSNSGSNKEGEYLTDDDVESVTYRVIVDRNGVNGGIESVEGGNNDEEVNSASSTDGSMPALARRYYSSSSSDESVPRLQPRRNSSLSEISDGSTEHPTNVRFSESAQSRGNRSSVFETLHVSRNNNNNGLSYLRDYGAIRVFASATCPMCLDDHSIVVALKCGHCLCAEDYCKLGGYLASDKDKLLAEAEKKGLK